MCAINEFPAKFNKSKFRLFNKILPLVSFSIFFANGRHTNDDIGGYYHSASGTPDNIVRGRYGSRNPATGQVEETVYTAGPRG